MLCILNPSRHYADIQSLMRIWFGSFSRGLQY